MTTVAETPSVTRRDAGWLLPPEVPPGLHLQFDSLLGAEHLSPEVIGLLGKLMAELQRAAQAVAAKGCPKLSSCLEFTGDCTKLTDCGTYKLQIATL